MGNNQPTDADLVASVLAGDREAFGCLYDRYARLVCAVVFGVTLDRPIIEDLTQECFLRAYRNLARLRRPERFGGWIAGIARQVARERKRTLRRDRHRFVSGDTLEIASEADVGATIETGEEIELVMRRLEELPQRERLAIQAFFLEERKAREAAELIGVSRSGLYAMIGRGLTRLADLVRCSEA